MVEPFKNLIGAATVRAAARHLRRAWPGFDAAGFEKRAARGLETLEFKARAMQLCDAFEATLPEPFARAADIIEASLGPPGSGDDLSALKVSPAGLAGWVIWPLGEFVARRGQHDPARALRCLHALTQRFSAEWAIRPFIEQHPKLSFDTLARWAHDPSAHVRRLVSEGSRPRLPWGRRLQGLIEDPSPTLPLLRVLQDDASPYVRRSVANHLNDIAKDHPQIVHSWLQQHLPDASAERQALLRHACRSLIKSGDVNVLKAFGLGARLRGAVSLELSPLRLQVGQSLRLQVRLQSESARTQRLLIDYAVHHVKASGRSSAKVFKGWALELAGGEVRELAKSHSMREVTTRRYHAGVHRVQLLVNGKALAEAAFELTV